MQQTGTKGVQDSAWLDEKGNPLGIVQMIKTLPYYKMTCAQTRISPREWDPKYSLDYWDKDGLLIPVWKADLC